MKVEDIVPGRVASERASHDTDERQPLAALAEQLAAVTVSSPRTPHDTLRAHGSGPAPTNLLAQLCRATPSPLGPTLGIDFSGTLQALRGQNQYQNAIALMADKLIEFANNKPNGWHFNLLPQAESAMVNFCLSHLSPELCERYKNKSDDNSLLFDYLKIFSRLFFFASATPLSRDRLKAYARRWMEVKTKVPKPPYIRVCIQKLMKRSDPHLSIPRDAYTALLLEIPKVFRANCPDEHTAALFCASGFGQMVNHINLACIAHPDARTAMHTPDEPLMSFEAHLGFLTSFYGSSGFYPEYIVNLATDLSMQWFSRVELRDAPAVSRPSATRMPATPR